MRRLGPAGNSQVSSVRTPRVSVFWRRELSSGREQQLPDLPRVRLVPGGFGCACVPVDAGTGRAKNR